MKYLLTGLLLAITITAFAQSKEDVFDGNKNVTWLGLDFSDYKFIGEVTQFADAGEVSNSDLRDKFFPAWNNLFLTEKDKYEVADAIGRTEVDYAIDVTNNSNSKIKSGFTSSDESEYHRLKEADISNIVRSYNYEGNKGIGMMFIVESMSKEQKQSSIWVTFINMDSKKVIFTERVDAKAGGFGFRNYWAKSFFNAIKATEDNWKKWRK